MKAWVEEDAIITQYYFHHPDRIDKWVFLSLHMAVAFSFSRFADILGMETDLTKSLLHLIERFNRTMEIAKNPLFRERSKKTPCRKWYHSNKIP
jgi:hypothetical protein